MKAIRWQIRPLIFSHFISATASFEHADATPPAIATIIAI